MTVESLLDAQTAARDRITAQVLAVIQRAWQGLPDWSGAQVDTFVTKVVPIIQAGQLQTARMTETYLVGVLTELLGEPVRPVGIPREQVADLRPVEPQAVYTRPFVEVWTALKQGAPIEHATAVGADRLSRLVQDDLSLAHRTASLIVMDRQDKVVGYRRVLRPELAKRGSCGLCVAAADQRYGRAKLMPIHTRCHCEVMPIVAKRSGDVLDPGLELNGQDVRSLYEQVRQEAGAGDKSALAAVRVQVHEHGELGPVLTRQGDEFAGPSDVAA